MPSRDPLLFLVCPSLEHASESCFLRVDACPLDTAASLRLVSASVSTGPGDVWEWEELTLKLAGIFSPNPSILYHHNPAHGFEPVEHHSGPPPNRTGIIHTSSHLAYRRRTVRAKDAGPPSSKTLGDGVTETHQRTRCLGSNFSVLDIHPSLRLSSPAVISSVIPTTSCRRAGCVLLHSFFLHHSKIAHRGWASCDRSFPQQVFCSSLWSGTITLFDRVILILLILQDAIENSCCSPDGHGGRRRRLGS